MKKSILVTIIIFLTFINAHAVEKVSKQLSDAQIKNLKTTFDKKFPAKDYLKGEMMTVEDKAKLEKNPPKTDWEIIKNQSFKISFKNKAMADAIFALATPKNAIHPNPRAIITDAGGQNIIAVLPEFDDYSYQADFKSVTSVIFTDINGDGFEDILIKLKVFDRRLAQGDSVGGHSNETSFAFLNDTNSGFIRDDKNCVEANTLKDLKTCYSKLKP